MTPLLLLFACADDPPPPITSEAPSAGAPPAVEAPDPAALWPLFGIAPLPIGERLAVPEGVKDLAVDPRGQAALVLTNAPGGWVAWNFGGSPEPLRSAAGLGEVTDIGFSPLDASLYGVVKGADGWRIARLRRDGDQVVEDAVLYRSERPLGDLVTARVRFDGRERLFFARDYDGEHHQILSVTRDGDRVYEVTSPDGRLSGLTDAALRQPADAWTLPPKVTEATSARPLSMDSATGTLLWSDGTARPNRLRYDVGNWGEVEAGRSPVDWAGWSPNGFLVLEGRSGEIVAREPGGREVGAAEDLLAGDPVIAPDGRSFIGRDGAGLQVAPLPIRPVATRYLATVEPERRPDLEKSGFLPQKTADYNDQLYEYYEGVLYESEPAPMVLSLDAMMEVLHAGFQAVFVQSERERSAPKLRALAEILAKNADPKLAELGDAVRRTLDGDLNHPEGQRIAAGVNAESPLLGRAIDYADFRPRGPYANDAALGAYFQAFKVMNSLRLDADQREALAADPALVSAWSEWVSVQAAFLQGTRQRGAFGDPLPAAAWASADCLPAELKRNPYRLFPLNWGVDSEALERSVAHDDPELPPACTVPRRGLPSGLDLLAALGSARARSLLAADYALYPELSGAHDALAAAWREGAPAVGLSGAWLRLLQVLANDARVPEGVDPDLWRNRLSESALGSWVNLRHTLVLVTENSAAEAGEGGPDVFEEIAFEPARDVVDPVPAAWKALGEALDKVAAEAKKSPDNLRVSDLLTSAAVECRRLGELAERQMRGQGLTADEYEKIHWYVRTVEEPYRLLLTAASGRSTEDYVLPDPVMKVVDVHDWNEPGQPKKILHIALGRPRVATWLLSDRGVLVPATGAFYGYYEVVTEEQRLNDEDWRAMLPEVARPAWVNPDR